MIAQESQEENKKPQVCMLQGRDWLDFVPRGQFSLGWWGHYLGVQVRYYQI